MFLKIISVAVACIGCSREGCSLIGSLVLNDMIHVQCRLARRSHTSQERKIRHIHRGVRKAIHVQCHLGYTENKGNSLGVRKTVRVLGGKLSNLTPNEVPRGGTVPISSLKFIWLRPVQIDQYQ